MSNERQSRAELLIPQNCISPPRGISRSISRRRVSDEGRITSTLTRTSGAAGLGRREIYRPAVPYGWLVGSQIQDSVRRARHRRRPAVEYMRIDHRGADVVVAQQFLDGADVAAVFEQMGGEGVSKRVRCSAFAEPRPPNSVEHGALQDRLVQVMTAALARSPVDIEPSSGKRPLPRPFPPCVRVFASEGPWQLDPAGATRQIGLMLSLHLEQLPGQRLLGHYRQHGDAVFGALAVADDDLIRREVD